MSLKGFENLREVESLLKVEKQHLDTIEGHRQRLSMLDNRIAEKQEKVEELHKKIDALKKQLNSNENQIEQYDSQIEKSVIAVDRAQNQQQAEASEKQLNNLNLHKDELQELTLNLMEDLETLEAEFEENQVFLKGAHETRKDVLKEVESDTSKEEQKLKDLKERIQNLLSITPDFLVQAFNRSCEKHRYQHPLTYLTERKCHYCRYTPESSLYNELERADEAFLCRGCRRLFTPSTRQP
jgi:predicted  nucleic acid-binding Zn-ribbon protein